MDLLNEILGNIGGLCVAPSKPRPRRVLQPREGPDQVFFERVPVENYPTYHNVKAPQRRCKNCKSTRIDCQNTCNDCGVVQGAVISNDTEYRTFNEDEGSQNRVRVEKAPDQLDIQAWEALGLRARATYTEEDKWKILRFKQTAALLRFLFTDRALLVHDEVLGSCARLANALRSMQLDEVNDEENRGSAVFWAIALSRDIYAKRKGVFEVENEQIATALEVDVLHQWFTDFAKGVTWYSQAEGATGMRAPGENALAHAIVSGNQTHHFRVDALGDEEAREFKMLFLDNLLSRKLEEGEWVDGGDECRLHPEVFEGAKPSVRARTDMELERARRDALVEERYEAKRIIAEAKWHEKRAKAEQRIKMPQERVSATVEVTFETEQSESDTEDIDQDDARDLMDAEDAVPKNDDSSTDSATSDEEDLEDAPKLTGWQIVSQSSQTLPAPAPTGKRPGRGARLRAFLRGKNRSTTELKAWRKAEDEKDREEAAVAARARARKAAKERKLQRKLERRRLRRKRRIMRQLSMALRRIGRDRRYSDRRLDKATLQGGTAIVSGEGLKMTFKTFDAPIRFDTVKIKLRGVSQHLGEKPVSIKISANRLAKSRGAAAREDAREAVANAAAGVEGFVQQVDYQTKTGRATKRRAPMD